MSKKRDLLSAGALIEEGQHDYLDDLVASHHAGSETTPHPSAYVDDEDETD